jgi:sodium/potassium-transporting ATPase subunit alpha
VEEVRRESLFFRFVKGFVHFFALIPWLAAALFLAEWIDPGQGMAKIGYAVVVVIVVSGIFPFGRNFESSEPWLCSVNCCRSRSKYYVTAKSHGY